MRVVITERDKNILEAILTFGMLSTRQIQSKFFKDVSIKTVQRRLRILGSGNWIRSTYGVGAENVWTLKEKGSRVLGEDYCLKINRNCLYHDLMCNDIRLTLEFMGVDGEWLSSHHLRYLASKEKNPYHRHTDSLPDWLFCMHDKTVAMEIELNLKGKRRMQETVEKYAYKRDDVHNIIYFVPTKRLGEKILKYFSSYRHLEGWIRVCVIDDFFKDPLKVTMRSFAKESHLAKYFGVSASTPAS